MTAVAKTRLLSDTSLNAINRAAALIPKNRFVGVGTPTGNELAIDELDVAGVAKALGVTQDDVAVGASATVFGPGSICAVESSGDDALSPGDELIVLAGGSLAASGRVRKLPTGTGTYYRCGKVVGSAVTAVAGALVLVRLTEVNKIIVA